MKIHVASRYKFRSFHVFSNLKNFLFESASLASFGFGRYLFLIFSTVWCADARKLQLGRVHQPKGPAAVRRSETSKFALHSSRSRRGILLSPSAHHTTSVFPTQPGTPQLRHATAVPSAAALLHGPRLGLWIVLVRAVVEDQFAGQRLLGQLQPHHGIQWGGSDPGEAEIPQGCQGTREKHLIRMVAFHVRKFRLTFHSSKLTL